MDKIRILAISDWADTGFGRVMQELLPRLVGTGLFEVKQLAWAYHGEPKVYEAAKARGIELHQVNGRHEWGRQDAETLIPEFKPHVVLTLGDPWMVDFVPHLRDREKFKWIAYTPIDREPICHGWVNLLKKPDVLVLYSKWGREVIERQIPFSQPQMIYHGVDSQTFRPLKPEVRRKLRANVGISPEAFVIGVFGRNQERKMVPRAMGAFKAFNCTCQRGARPWLDHEATPREKYSCPCCGRFEQDPEKESSALWLHMTLGNGPHDRGVTWDINELVTRYDLERGRVHATPGLTTRFGVDDEKLCSYYNLLDVHLMLAKREGFCLPVLESMSCGVPNVVVDYSAHAELVRESRAGLLAQVQAFYCDTHFEAESAIASIPSAASMLERLYRDPDLRAEMGGRGRQFALDLDWDNLVEPWVRLTHDVLGRSVPVPAPQAGDDASLRRSVAGRLAVLQGA